MELTMTMSLDESEQTFNQLFDEDQLLLGPEGKSAYQVAVENGFEGSEEEWLASLEGKDGRTPILKVERFEDDAGGRSGVNITAINYSDDGSILDYLGTVYDGADGHNADPELPEAISPTATVTQTENGALIVITDKDGTTQAVVENGEDGLDGLTPIVELEDNYKSSSGQLGVLVKVKQPYRTEGSNLVNYGFYEVPIYHGTDGKSAKIASIKVESLAAGATPSATVTDTALGSIITLKIPKSDPGKDGDDGFSPTVGVSKSGKVTTVTVVDKNGAKTATINDGADGYTPVKDKDYFDGKDGIDGYSPVRGKDYWTPSDIAEIKSYVDEAILGGAW